MRKRATRTKPSGMLASFAETKKNKTVLLGDIQTHVVKKANEDSDRRQDIIHPSEMAKSDWCPRATALRISGQEPSNPPSAKGHRMETIFQEGHDIHAKWQTWLGEMDRIAGKWLCSSCGFTIWGTAGEVQCMNVDCSSLTPLEYREVPLDAEDTHLIVGHSDGLVPDEKALIEIKSIGLGTVRMEEPDLVRKYTVKAEGSGKSVVDYDALWKGIKRPLASHRRQALLYLFLCRLRGIEADRMVFIYENKANQDTKEFVITFSEEAVAPLIDQALDIKWAVENNRRLPRPEGLTKQLKPCSDCVFRDLCYREDEDGEARDAEPHAGDGARVSGGEAEDGSAADLHADSSGRRVPRTAGRSHRTGRRRTDEPVRGADEVGGVPERPVGSSGGRRTVRRRVT